MKMLYKECYEGSYILTKDAELKVSAIKKGKGRHPNRCGSLEAENPTPPLTSPSCVHHSNLLYSQ